MLFGAVGGICQPENIFTEYAYFSSYSDSWLKHASDYVDMISERLRPGSGSLAVELASNDGYLLQYFVKKGIPALGVEPAANVARVAEQKGVPTLVKFFGCQTAREMVAAVREMADLVTGNNGAGPGSGPQRLRGWYSDRAQAAGRRDH